MSDSLRYTPESTPGRSPHEAAAPTSGNVIHGRLIQEDFEASADVIVIGSGAGGSVVATKLAEAGRRVIVLEEGPYYRPEEYQRFEATESLRRLFRSAGLLTALGVGQTPIISLMAGRAVGGSSLLTGGVCFRIPSEVHAHWTVGLGLNEWSERGLESCYEEVEERMRVREVPESLRSASTQRFVDGAASLGIAVKSNRRNTGHECEGNGRCNFTCPKGAKRSVDLSYLPHALRHGAAILSDALVDRIRVRSGRAVGVEGRLLTGAHGEPGHRFVVHAPVVVSCCGALHTPLLLRRAGVARYRGLVGQGLTLHPGARIAARFDDNLEGWNGAMQSVYSSHFDPMGIKLVGIYGAPNMLAGAMPGVGPHLRQRARNLGHYGFFGAMIHDEGGGTVWPALGREPIVTYRMAPRDLERLRHSFTVLAEMAFAAGAKEVIPPIFGVPPVQTMDEARRLETMRYDATRIECGAFHPLGSARAANDERRGVVRSTGETFDVQGLYVADGSILPTSIGVNSQVPIMTLATHVARCIDAKWQKLARQAPLA